MTTTDLTIAEQVATLEATLADHAPAEVLSAFRAERVDLVAGGVPATVAAPGMAMPDGHLLDAHGAPTTLAQAHDGRPAVVVFYRGAWCPYCNLALRAYQAQLEPALTEQGVALIAVSPQKPDGALTMQETNELTFTVLSDPGNQIGTALGILSPERPAAARDAAAALGADVASTNGDGTDTVPMPTVVIVDAGGTVRWIDVHPDYSTRSEPEQILAALASTVG